jgi:hypothetical protein
MNKKPTWRPTAGNLLGFAIPPNSPFPRSSEVVLILAGIPGLVYSSFSFIKVKFTIAHGDRETPTRDGKRSSKKG